jgi:hypothetical protein
VLGLIAIGGYTLFDSVLTYYEVVSAGYLDNMIVVILVSVPVFCTITMLYLQRQ